MPDKVNGINSRRIEEVHHENEICTVDILKVDFSSCLVVYDN